MGTFFKTKFYVHIVWKATQKATKKINFQSVLKSLINVIYRKGLIEHLLSLFSTSLNVKVKISVKNVDTKCFKNVDFFTTCLTSKMSTWIKLRLK